jgi:hypothetical protein
VQQAPVAAGKVALLAYHVENAGKRRQIAPGHVLIEKGGLGHLWSTQLCASATDRLGDAGEQTRGIFNALVEMLEANGATLADNCVRTWIYVKDVDLFYQDVVAARTPPVRAAGPDAEHPLPGQHRNRGRVCASLRRGAHGRILDPRSAASADVVFERL